MAYNKNLFLIEGTEAITTFLEDKSPSMSLYIKNNPNSTYVLLHKYLTHSDLTNRGKRNGSTEGLEKNYLYYLTVKEMKEIEAKSNKPFESAKQSNIGLGDSFYEKAGIPRLQRRSGFQDTQHDHLKLNDYCNVYLVNDTMKYFTMDYTSKVFDKLNKKPLNWDFDNSNIKLDDHNWITEIQISEAIHGIGTEQDTEFHKLRLSMFKNDILMLLIEQKPNNSKKNIFIMLEKNPIFFSLIGESNNAWSEYLTKKTQKEEIDLKLSQEVFYEEKTRAQQASWKNKLAEEIMNFTTKDGEVFCPFTYISSNFEKVSSLFIASHIKRYEHSDAKEAWDINNGLLLCANADALFDKYLITINEDKKLVFSFTIDNDEILKEKLLLNQPIFSMILNEKRMNYMKFHREIFMKKELERKSAYAS